MKLYNLRRKRAEREQGDRRGTMPASSDQISPHWLSQTMHNSVRPEGENMPLQPVLKL